MSHIVNLTRRAVDKYFDKQELIVVEENQKSVLYRLAKATTTCVIATHYGDEVCLRVFSNGKLARTADMKLVGAFWTMVKHDAANKEVFLKDFLPLASNGVKTKVTAPVKTDRTNKPWSKEEYNQLCTMFAHMLANGTTPAEINSDTLQAEFGPVVSRNEGAINTRLSYLTAVLEENNGHLVPTIYDYHLPTICDIRDALRDLGVSVWEGEWSTVRPKKKVLVTMDTLADKIPSLTKLGKKVSMNAEELEALLAELQN